MILVSACLLGECCKYDGGHNRSEAVLRFLEGKEWVAVCPERDGGLPTPRVPSEIRGARVISRDGLDVTEEFRRGAMRTLETAKHSGAELAVLKARSPSCGPDGVYDGSFSGVVVPGMGVTAALLTANGVRVISEEDVAERAEADTD